MRSLTFALILSALLLPFSVAQAQGPFAEPKNLQVIPDTVKGSQLRQIMRRFSAALGEQCSYCHAPSEDGEGLDFESDANDKKRVTREMIKLVRHVNQVSASLYPDNPDHKPTSFVCTTCHRGQANPFLIEEVMNNQIAEGGTAAAQAKYLELKEEYYGSHTYDFTSFTLAEYANRLLISGDLTNALEMAKFSTEQFPQEAYAHSVLGNVYVRQRNLPEAITAFEASLAINPNQDGLRRQIERAKETMEQ